MNMQIYLADIGNTHFHIYDGSKVVHLNHHDAIKQYQNKPLRYISVNSHIEEQISCIKGWENVSSLIQLPGEYATMGVDRKALCLSHNDGLFVDAGSAITIDVVEQGFYKGGCIFPGIKAILQCYGNISPILDVSFEEKLDLTRLPLTTKEQINYGIIAPIKILIEKYQQNKQIYIIGGDRKLLSHFIKDAVYDEALVFKGIMYALLGTRVKNSGVSLMDKCFIKPKA
ncbi:MAG: type III pantothenate kinase [Sulfurovum sp.]|nr:type III pantothenate kinase [Sulfurovum sp.]MCB4760170.1 type III pantothenate kinase [Sulfurovum sp.]